MATPKYDALVTKVRDWSNKKEAATLPISVIEDCLKYSADMAYQRLRIPPLEQVSTYTITQENNDSDDRFSVIETPGLLIEFIYLRVLPTSPSAGYSGIVFNQVTDARTFLDPYSNKYSEYNYMWLDNSIKLSPQLEVGTILEVSFYRRLPDLDAVYSVIPTNYIIGLSDSEQVYLELVSSGGTNLYFSTSGGVEKVFSTNAEAAAYDSTVTTKMYTGNESSNWMRDSNERILMWGALMNVGSYIFDTAMEEKYANKFKTEVDALNSEEKFRRAKGGNVQMHFNTNGLI